MSVSISPTSQRGMIMDALVISLAVNIFWHWPVAEVFTDGHRLLYFALTFLAGFAVVYGIDLAIRSIIRSRRRSRPSWLKC